MADRGTLEKLLIKAYDQPGNNGRLVGEFEAFINPNEITMSYEFEYDAANGAGATASRMNFKNAKPGDLSLVFFIDGTGANGPSLDVQQRIEKFQTVTGYSGKVHRPNYLKVIWGTLPVKCVVLKSASIAYKLFESKGIPLRAVITATFAEYADDETRVAKAQDESADLTHIRLIKAGDNLPVLCFEIYDDPKYYLEVARINRLNDFRQLVPGTRIHFPPLQK